MSQALETGTYEIIRERLGARAKDLVSKLDQLNEARKEAFGTIEFALQGSDRITTANNCVPRDIVAIGPNTFLFGYNVHFGLKTETNLDDVFAFYEFRDKTFHPLPLDSLQEPQFIADFKDLYKYYKQTTLSKFRLVGPNLYMAFQVGKSSTDIKAFKWAVDEGKLTYLGNRFDHEFKFPPLYEFEWKRATRDAFRQGKHPHVSIEDQLFVDTVGGDLTIKVEDNTSTGNGIYSEPVENKDQTLDDAEIHYARLGNLFVLKIKPFQEKQARYLVFNSKTADIVRLDAVGLACALLPEDQGIIFPGGYYLASGDYKTFEGDYAEMIMSKRINAPNGEDSLYVFYSRDNGTYALFSYNRISQEVQTPILCHGVSLFPSGQMILFRSEREAQKHHIVQIWQTPYLGRNVVMEARTDSFLSKLGNSTVVSALAEGNEILHLLKRDDSYSNLYIDLVRRCNAVSDSYFWLDKPEAFDIKSTLLEIKKAAGTALDEFEKVRAIKKSTETEIAKTSEEASARIKAIDYNNLTSIDLFVEHLAALRALRGRVISLKDLRYMDLPRITQLEEEITDHSEKLSRLSVEFLLQPDALKSYEERIAAQKGKVPQLIKGSEAAELGKEADATGQQLEMLIEVVSSLKIEDATQTTRIIDTISALYGSLNQVRAALKNRRRDLQSTESAAQFAAQIKLLDQSATNFLDLAESAQKCDEFLSKLTLQLEELEGKYADFDDYITQLAGKREEIYSAFEARKVQLNEARGKKASGLASAADRLLKTIRNRADSIKVLEEINGYFAADLMVAKVRDTVEQLLAMGETVKGDEIQSRLKTTREDAVRQLKDRLDLYADGENLIKLGQHRFTVNTQALDLTVVPRDNTLTLHISGTNFFEPLGDGELEELQDVWNQDLASETEAVYRSEFLAYEFLQKLASTGGLDTALVWDGAQRLDAIRAFMAPRYSEGYVKGVHDADAALIFETLLKLHLHLETLRFTPLVRSLARLAWNSGDPIQRESLAIQMTSLGKASALFNNSSAGVSIMQALQKMVSSAKTTFSGFEEVGVEEASNYLFVELSDRPVLRLSRPAADLAAGFLEKLKKAKALEDLQEARRKLEGNPAAEFGLLTQWMAAWIQSSGSSAAQEKKSYACEACVLLFQGPVESAQILDTAFSAVVDGLSGTHPRLASKPYALDYHEFSARVRHHVQVVLPRFQRCAALKQSSLEKRRDDLRLEGFKPKVLSSFVRSRLIDEIYLPLIGSNLAKQIGVAGENKRTDRMGLLLLISPPGYGKTTLVEYIANRLGLVFMKINGPALGHQVTSLDPNGAPNAAAREEIIKLNLALEMGDNVMICVDDIQHCNPEFLQKFISLCDAQRKIEGVWNGRPRTYDLRGRKVVVVMAGNPYTESGEKFKIPDMLSNRADTYNLGDIIGSNASAFEQSYLENSITSNPILQRLSAQGQADVRQVIHIAESGSAEGSNFKGNYSPEELNEMVLVMKHLAGIRDTILRVNLEYIRSAAQSDAYRTEPAFKLQGSYRNMNRLAEKILPVMNDSEVDALLLDHYKNDAQTLTTGAEANLLKLREMLGLLSDDEALRWADIKQKFQRNQLLAQSDSNDPVGKVVGQLALFHQSLEHLRGTLAHGFAQSAEAAARTAIPVMAVPVAAAQPSAEPVASAPEPAENVDSSNPYVVEVRYGVPETFTNIIEQQFEMMQTWTKQAFSAEKLKSEEMQFLNVQISSLAQSYKLLIENLKSNKIL